MDQEIEQSKFYRNEVNPIITWVVLGAFLVLSACLFYIFKQTETMATRISSHKGVNYENVKNLEDLK